MELVEVSKLNRVGIITINNPPVNALSPDVQAAIGGALKRFESDAEISAVVMTGAGRNFVAGADIKKFVEISNGDAPFSEEGLQPLLRLIEDCPKPVIMAVNGVALGGGLELAMSGHYRVAAPDASFGQAEVKLGLMPGGAGSQRLPRLVGVAKGLEMCYGGEPISVREAAALGLVDLIIHGDFVSQAASFAEKVADEKPPKTRDRLEKIGDPQNNAILFSDARATAQKKFRNLEAPLRAIEAVERGLQLPFEEACKLERQLFKACLFSEQSKALIHVFFAERDVVKIPDIPKDTPTLPIRLAAVVGAGTMGSGIAMAFANAGIPVSLNDADDAALDRGLETIRANYANSVNKGRLQQSIVDERLKLIRPVRNLSELAAADIVVEAAFEDLALKKGIFAELDKVCGPATILASNTSTLSIDEIASSTSRPERVIGTHFFSPANVMRLLEVVRGRGTAKETIATCMLLAKKLGKVAVLVRNSRGFVGNRMYHAYRCEAQFLVEEGAPFERVDEVLYNFGMAMGPFAAADLAGLDVGWKIRREHRHLLVPGVRQPIIEDKLCELGRYGQKTGAGWYKYDAERKRYSDPELFDKVRNWSVGAGLSQRDISDQDILERCLFAMVNEGAKILEEGIALRSGDIDTIFVNGYGFPPYRGGPMWYAERVGLNSVYQRIAEFERAHGKAWEPAPRFRAAVDAKRFSLM
jgi:3-hydroxyacyl-CoA dehydrogenase